MKLKLLPAAFLRQCMTLNPAVLIASVFMAVIVFSPGLFLGAAFGAETDNATLQFMDSGSFDRKLSSHLKKEIPTVKVVFVTPTTTNSIPERIDKWFAMVEKHEGTVELKPDPEYAKDRGILSEIVSLAVGVYSYYKEKFLYDPIKHYNAVVYYKKGSGAITRIEFKLKQMP